MVLAPHLCHTGVCVSSVVVWPCLTTLCLAAVCQHLCGNHLTKPLVLCVCHGWCSSLQPSTTTHQPSMWCDTHMVVVVELLHMHHVWCTWWPHQHHSHTKLTDRWPQRVMVLHTMHGLAIQQTCACHPVVLLVVNKWWCLCCAINTSTVLNHTAYQPTCANHTLSTNNTHHSSSFVWVLPPHSPPQHHPPLGHLFCTGNARLPGTGQLVLWTSCAGAC